MAFVCVAWSYGLGEAPSGFMANTAGQFFLCLLSTIASPACRGPFIPDVLTGIVHPVEDPAYSAGEDLTGTVRPGRSYGIPPKAPRSLRCVVGGASWVAAAPTHSVGDVLTGILAISQGRRSQRTPGDRSSPMYLRGFSEWLGRLDVRRSLRPHEGQNEPGWRTQAG